MNVHDETTREDLRNLARWRQTARVLVEALPYILAYDNKTIVVKYGGHAMEGGVPTDFAQDIVLMKQTGIDPVVVHGGGPQIGAMLKKLNITSSFVDGLRVTDAAAMEVVEMVLTGSINKQIVTGINAAGGRAVGVSGKDGNLVLARRSSSARRLDPATGERVADRSRLCRRARARRCRSAAHDHEFRPDSGGRADRRRPQGRDLQHQRRHGGRRGRRRDRRRAPDPADRCRRRARPRGQADPAPDGQPRPAR